jgi:glutamate dehydrogenase (NAD(P)+)
MLEEAKQKEHPPRDAALDLAQRRVMKAMAFKRWEIF